MPPLLRPAGHSTVASFLRPFLQQAQQCQHQQVRSASILSQLSDNSGAYNRRIRRGRGASSGKGKTSGRGHKGQKARGKVPVGFAGGQTPENVVHGERGFENEFSVDMAPLNINTIQSYIDIGRIDPSKPITLKEIAPMTHGLRNRDGVKLLARGASALTTPIHIVVSRASASAIAAVEAQGGSVTTRYYTRDAIARVMAGKTHPVHSLLSKTLPFEAAAEAAESLEAAMARTKKFAYRLPDPTSRKDIEYYRDPAHRGYLSYMVGEGQGPSLFFKTPGQGRVDRKTAAGKGGKSTGKSENRLW